MANQKSLSEQTPPALILAGPTASGKTELALSLAACFPSEIVCMDSMQLYRGMDIGTAKPTEEEKAGIPHHLFDCADPDDPFSVARYVEAARNKAEEITARGHLPIFCGGTPQYATALVTGMRFIELPHDPQLREAITNRYQQEGGEVLIREIALRDPETAARLAPADQKRIVRALEVFEQTGKTLSEINQLSLQAGPERPYHLLFLEPDRNWLYPRINQRVGQMFQQGLTQEVEQLFERYPQEGTALRQAIGYKEFLPYFEKRSSLDETADKIRQNSRNYAKRQMSWFRSKAYVYRLFEHSHSRRMQILQNEFLSRFCAFYQ